MRIFLRVLKWPLAALLLAAPASAAYAAAGSQDVAVSIVNNTEALGRGDIGRMIVNCGGSNQRVDNGQTVGISCTVADGESLRVTYNGIGYRGTVTVDCGTGERPDFIDESAVTLTFTGAGTAVTMTQSCTGLG